tara:strand:+ start:755 stop:898 length:144 start_codon:yes stop_codon:yes gene_type:complete
MEKTFYWFSHMAGFDPKAQIGDNSPTVAGVAELADAMDSKSILVHPK